MLFEFRPLMSWSKLGVHGTSHGKSASKSLGSSLASQSKTGGHNVICTRGCRCNVRCHVGVCKHVLGTRWTLALSASLGSETWLIEASTITAKTTEQIVWQNQMDNCNLGNFAW